MLDGVIGTQGDVGRDACHRDLTVLVITMVVGGGSRGSIVFTTCCDVGHEQLVPLYIASLTIDDWIFFFGITVTVFFFNSR